MRIVLDLQACQANTRHHGIGRYSLSLAQAMIREGEGHEFWIVLSSLFPETIPLLRATFAVLIPTERIVVCELPGPTDEHAPENSWRSRAASAVYEFFLAQLKPDLVHLSVPIDCAYGDHSVTPFAGNDLPFNVAVTLYDFIPLIYPDSYLTNPTQKESYNRRINALKNSSLALAISENTRQEAIKHLGIHPERVVNISAAAETHFSGEPVSHDAEHTIRVSYGLHLPFVMYAPSGFDLRKNMVRFLEAYANLPRPLRDNLQLAIVGKIPDRERSRLTAIAKSHQLVEEELVFTGYVSDADLAALYGICQLFVFPSLHEGFGLPVLEAMACGAPVIGANTTSIPEVIGLDEALFDPTDSQAISEAMYRFLTNPSELSALKAHSLKQAKHFTWQNCARRALKAIENIPNGTQSSKDEFQRLIERLQTIPKAVGIPSDEDLVNCAKCIASNGRFRPHGELLIDISELVQRDAKSGIQRVVRGVLAKLLSNPPYGLSPRPVYFDGQNFRYADSFTARFLESSSMGVIDEIIDVQRGDIYLCLDLTIHLITQTSRRLSNYRNMGVDIYFVVYDILPFVRPDWWPQGSWDMFSKWLKAISEVSTGLVCISRSVAEEVGEALQFLDVRRKEALNIGYFHLGADIEQSRPSVGMPAESASVLQSLKSSPTFIMVGTIEPRKGYAQTLLAFDVLWASGIDTNLVFVGKHGWMVDDLVARFKSHPEFNKRFFWLAGISDEYLENVYAASTCLIAASEGEGFGLPLIEAAQHKLPIIARDIPVFREVAGDNAYYFSGLEAADLADTIKDWLALDKAGKAPQSDTMPWLTWAQSTQQLLDVLLNDNWMTRWMPDGCYRYSGSDARLGSHRVGKKDGLIVQTNGAKGHLLYGPYLPLPAGRYQVRLHGLVKSLGTPQAYADVAIQKGSKVLFSHVLAASPDAGLIAEMEVHLKSAVNDFEVRVWVAADSDLSISKMEIIPESLFDKQTAPLAGDRVTGGRTQEEPMACGDGFARATRRGATGFL